MYQYPTDPANYALTRAGKFYPSRRNGPVLGVVLHITAGLEDFDGADNSAEGTARWAAGGGASVSWHVGVDSDSIVPCLPATYTAWHAAGYNSRTFGIEISKRNVTWATAPADWVTRTLRNAARALAPIVKQYNLPLTLCTKAQVDSAQAAGRPFGFVYHSSTSAGTRSDPGKDFPFTRLVDMIRTELAPTPTKPAPTAPTSESPAPTAPSVRLTEDGSFGPKTITALQLHMIRAYKVGTIKAGGAWGVASSAALERCLNHEASKRDWAQPKVLGTLKPGVTNVHSSRLRWLVGVAPVAGGWTKATTLNLQRYINKKNGL